MLQSPEAPLEHFLDGGRVSRKSDSHLETFRFSRKRKPSIGPLVRPISLYPHTYSTAICSTSADAVVTILRTGKKSFQFNNASNTAECPFGGMSQTEALMLLGIHSSAHGCVECGQKDALRVCQRVT